MTHPFNPAELKRYSRQINLPEIGIEGQKRLKAARVFCIGAGGLGSPTLTYLAATGVGTIGIIDNDIVDESNLARQTLYYTEHIGKKKITIVKKQLESLNPFIKIAVYDDFLSSENATQLISQYDIVVDGSDNFATRYLVNDVCYRSQKPLVHASLNQFDAHCTVFKTNESPCYRCLYPNKNESSLNCSEAGILGSIPGILGTIQATEVLKLILQIGKPLIGRLLKINLLTMQFQEIKLQQDPHCRLCTNQQEFESMTYIPFVKCEHSQTIPTEISAKELQNLMQQDKNLQLLDVREPNEYEICHLESKLVPLAQLNTLIPTLHPEYPIVVYCKLGGRSLQAAKQLIDAGFKNVKYLTGGIMAWKNEIDPTLQAY